jgi:hypothetical protein
MLPRTAALQLLLSMAVQWSNTAIQPGGQLSNLQLAASKELGSSGEVDPHGNGLGSREVEETCKLPSSVLHTSSSSVMAPPRFAACFNLCARACDTAWLSWLLIIGRTIAILND